jgi:hypothetical protein
MYHSVFDWIARVIGLVLAMMVTLSIIGAIAAIPSNSLGDRFGWQRPGLPANELERGRSIPAEPAGPADEGVEPRQEEAGRHISVAQAAAPRPDPASAWLEVIAYALIAIACLAALGVLSLWRSSRELGRIAERLERSEPNKI